MFRKASKCMLILLMFISIFLTSCMEKAVNKQKLAPVIGQDSNQVSEDLQYLCTNECGGRAIGTTGNIKAGDYISRRFKEIALEPLNSDYQIPYKKQVETIKKITLELLDMSRPVYTFNYGKDFLEVSLDDTILTLPLYSEPANSDCIVLIDDAQKAAEYEKNSHTKMLIVKEQRKYAKAAYFYTNSCIPQIKVTKEAFQILQNNIGKTVQFYADIDIQEMEHKNIVGAIKGQNNDNALILSAHFDHIGSIGKPGSSDYIIWRGALDNASGVSTMLEAARCLKNIYKDQKPPYDIIFCAFNGEEQLITNGGSSYFAKYIKEKYSSVFNINMDSLGDNDNAALFMLVNETTESMTAAQKIIDNLKSQNISVNLITEDCSSDHTSFENAICFSTISNISKSIIHTPEDTPDKVNISFISKIAGKLANCIRDTIGTIGVDKMKSTETTQNPNLDITTKLHTFLTPVDFENKFNCKLDFLNFKQADIDILSRIGAFIQSKGEPAPAKDIPDIRNITFNMKPGTISFTTYKTKSENEMQIYKQETDINGFTDKSKAQQISIDENTYYLFTREGEKSKFLITEFQGKDIIISVSVNYPDFNKFNSSEQYEDFFEKKGLKKLINCVVILFQERG